MRALVSLLLMSSFPAVLSKPVPGAIEPGKHWTWPAPADFEKAWDARVASGRSYRVLTGALAGHETQHYDEKSSRLVDDPRPAWADVERLSECHAASVVFVEHEKGLDPLLPMDDPWCASWSWTVVKREGQVLFLEAQGAVARFVLADATPAREVPQKYLTDWTYAATLLQPKASGAALLADYEKNAPMGRCSMDTRPQLFASQSADDCYAKGELACFLQLQVKVMGDQFERVAYSSYGEASHPTYASRLESTGIDVDRFFRGLVLTLPGERPSELGASRLARALIESGRRDKFETLLMDMAQDDALDTMNRYRAFTTYVSMQYRAQGEDVREKTAAKVGLLKLDALSKAWWEAVQRAR
jgi:hypothetical protein